MLEAKTIMKTKVVTVKKETPIYDAIELISTHKITGMPVVDDDMHLVGVVSEKDVLHLLNDLDNLMLVDQRDKDLVSDADGSGRFRAQFRLP